MKEIIKRTGYYLQKDRAVFLLSLLIVLIDRFLLLENFNFNFVRSDDMIYWQSATDYMKGVFHEPYFYGQNYNFMLDSIFAIPLIKLNIPYSIAFPIVSSLISLFPFILFAGILFNKGHKIEAIFFTLIPLLLPIEYGILNSICGFSSGLFFAGFFVFPLLKPFSKSSWFIAALAVSLSYICNPSSLVFSIPICVYLFLINFRRLSFYLINIATVIPILSIEYFAKRFYLMNAEYNVCGMWNFEFSFSKMFNNFQHLDKFFKYSTPIFWSAGWLALVFILIAGIVIMKKDWKKGISLIIGLVFIIFTLGINKVNDDSNTIFLSSTRMFLGIPLLIGLVFFWSKGLFTISHSTWKFGLIIIAITLFLIKSNLFVPVIIYHTEKTNYGPVAIKNVNDLKCNSCFTCSCS